MTSIQAYRHELGDYYHEDNTCGYTHAELRKLNSRLIRELHRDGVNMFDADTVQCYAETVLRDYDSRPDYDTLADRIRDDEAIEGER